MARIVDFIKADATGRKHPTEVECGFSVTTIEGETYLELRTFGSDHRRSEKKVSQTLQLDKASAKRVLALILDAFPDLHARD